MLDRKGDTLMTKRTHLLSLLLLPLITVMLAACGGEQAVQPATGSGSTVTQSQPNPPVASSQSQGPSAPVADAVAAHPQMIMFSTTWCTICKAMRPIVSDLKTVYQSKVDFREIDREDPANAAIVAKYHINAQPIFVFLDRKGSYVGEIIGGTDRRTLEDALDQVAATQ